MSVAATAVTAHRLLCAASTQESGATGEPCCRLTSAIAGTAASPSRSHPQKPTGRMWAEPPCRLLQMLRPLQVWSRQQHISPGRCQPYQSRPCIRPLGRAPPGLAPARSSLPEPLQVQVRNTTAAEAAATEDSLVSDCQLTCRQCRHRMLARDVPSQTDAGWLCCCCCRLWWEWLCSCHAAVVRVAHRELAAAKGPLLRNSLQDCAVCWPVRPAVTNPGAQGVGPRCFCNPLQ
jgi:hypothetical protein